MSGNERIRAELHALQQSRCGICGMSESIVRSLVLDHDHDSGFIRGLLCGPCNIAEARHGCDQPIDWCAVCSWRARPAVSWLGYTEHYDGANSVPSVFVATNAWQPSRTAIARYADADLAAAIYMERLVFEGGAS